MINCHGNNAIVDINNWEINAIKDILEIIGITWRVEGGGEIGIMVKEWGCLVWTIHFSNMVQSIMFGKSFFVVS